MDSDFQIPGKVNRPRYTLWFLHIFFVIYIYEMFRDDYNEELVKLDLYAPSIDLNKFCNFIVIVWATGGEIIVFLPQQPSCSELRVKAKEVFKKFIEGTGLIYKGCKGPFLNNAGGVLHPVDFFIKRFYDRYYPRESTQAFATYKRTNATLQLRCDYIEKFAEPVVKEVPEDELEEAVDDLLEEVFSAADFDLLKRDIKDSVECRRFSDLKVDLTSAAGYPFRQGIKKRDVHREAVSHAYRMLDDDDEFLGYMREHVWYTTGRAKMQDIDAADSARLIVYSGYASLLISMLLIQSWSRFMNRCFVWCGVGFSWMNDGAGKFARLFKANRGYAPSGFRYVSLDISGWDTKLHPSVMKQLMRFYIKLMDKCEVEKSYKDRFRVILQDMLHAIILMPMGHMFQVLQGMRSGWANTANDNTLLHEIIFRCIMRRLKADILHVLYGDDNFMLVPDHITDRMLVNMYHDFGLVVKHIHSSRYIGDVDFLSKHIHYRNNNYYVFRDSVETHSRLLMPEEMDPRRRERPDVVIAVERVIGHLLDNPFNSSVRDICYDLLRRFKREYHIDYIDIDDETFKKHPWRSFDRSLLPSKFPTVPEISFIEELYGVPIPENLRVVWPAKPKLVEFDPDNHDMDMVAYSTASAFANDVAVKCSGLAGKRHRSLVRKMSPYSQPDQCYGFHAARFEFAIKYFGIRFCNVLDLGSHPGACAASAIKFCDSVVCVSQRPARDTGQFCPYIAKDQRIKIVEADANDYVPVNFFDLQHDDVDIVGSRTKFDDINIGHGMIRRCIKNRKYVKNCLLTLKEVNWETIELMYEAYSKFGYINMVRPCFSNPWKGEFMVHFRVDKAPPVRKAKFRTSIYAFLNSMTSDMFRWNECIVSCLAGYRGVGSVPSNPNQTGDYEKDWITPWVDA